MDINWSEVLPVAIPSALSIASAVLAAVFAAKAQKSEHEAQRLRALEDRVAEKKFDLYLPFLQILGEMLTPGRSEAVAPERLTDAIADFQSFVTVWGSDDVVRAFYRYRVGAGSNPSTLVTMRLMADFLLAIRKDIAWPNTSIGGLHVLGMRINDLHEHPELANALATPLSELCAVEKWDPPFELTRADERPPRFKA